MDESEQQKTEWEISIAKEEMQRPTLTKEQVIFRISRFKNGNVNDMAFRQRLIDTFVNAVYLYDDRMVLTYNVKDGTDTIPLCEINKTFGEDNEGSDLAPSGEPRRRGPNGLRGDFL